MRLNGALKPHGAPFIGRSIGAKNYRDKRPQQKSKIADCDPNNNNNHNNTLIAIRSYQSNNITTLPTATATATAAVANNNFKRTQGYFNPSNSSSCFSTDKTDDDDADSFIHTQSNRTYKRNNSVTSAAKMALNCSRTSDSNAAIAKGRKRRGVASAAVVNNEAVAAKRQQRHPNPMRAPQSLLANLGGLSTLVLCLVYVCVLLPSHVICDDDNGFFLNTFSMGLETTTPEFDYVSRGKKKFGDKCENTLECGFPGSICDPKKKSCQCVEELPVTNHIDKCGKEAAVNESCFFNEQCESQNFQTECRDGRCICRFEMVPILNKDGVFECTVLPRDEKRKHMKFDETDETKNLSNKELQRLVLLEQLKLIRMQQEDLAKKTTM